MLRVVGNKIMLGVYDYDMLIKLDKWFSKALSEKYHMIAYDKYGFLRRNGYVKIDENGEGYVSFKMWKPVNVLDTFMYDLAADWICYEIYWKILKDSDKIKGEPMNPFESAIASDMIAQINESSINRVKLFKKWRSLLKRDYEDLLSVKNDK